MAAVPARSPDYPDIIVIQHESIFDPRIFGLPVEPIVEAFLSPKNGLSRKPQRRYFWRRIVAIRIQPADRPFKRELRFKRLFSVSSEAPADSTAVFQRRSRRLGTGRCSRRAAVAAFSTTTGFTVRSASANVFSRKISTRPSTSIDSKRHHSDALFLDAALNAHMKGIADDASPRFLYALTNFNHGPHSRRLVAPGQFEGERAFAAASLPDAHYAEYYARLVETAATWNRLKSELSSRFPGRPTLIVHYGDHQPVMTRRIEKKLKLAPGPETPVPYVLCHRNLE